ncbi:gp203 [Bacillus phage G]|uniref:Gp203 n=1 Tax=Bacillus phage G TaxID=2884420 RepID=G3MBR9_9CAUD|nr:gp203 [Bacillus phage G]AEO93462.1 gp203 [Bacillus phage G]
MIEIRLRDIIKGLISLPFEMLFVSLDFSSRRKRKKLVREFTDCLDNEVKEFAKFLDFEDIELIRYKESFFTDGTTLELRFRESHDNETSRLTVVITGKCEIRVGYGNGWAYYKNNDIDNIASNMLRYLDRIKLSLEEDKHWHQEIFNPLLESYNVKGYQKVRHAHIVNLFGNTHEKSIRAKQDLIDFFGDEVKADSFIKDINNIYLNRIVLYKMLK